MTTTLSLKDYLRELGNKKCISEKKFIYEISPVLFEVCVGRFDQAVDWKEVYDQWFDVELSPKYYVEDDNTDTPASPRSKKLIVTDVVIRRWIFQDPTYEFDNDKFISAFTQGENMDEICFTDSDRLIMIEKTDLIEFSQNESIKFDDIPAICIMGTSLDEGEGEEGIVMSPRSRTKKSQIILTKYLTYGDIVKSIYAAFPDQKITSLNYIGKDIYTSSPVALLSL